MPVKSENTVVLLSREVQSGLPALKDLDLDLSLWQPIIEERAFVPWLVREPSEQEALRARQITIQQINRYRFRSREPKNRAAFCGLDWKRCGRVTPVLT